MWIYLSMCYNVSVSPTFYPWDFYSFMYIKLFSILYCLQARIDYLIISKSLTLKHLSQVKFFSYIIIISIVGLKNPFEAQGSIWLQGTDQGHDESKRRCVWYGAIT